MNAARGHGITGHYSLEIFCYNPETDCFTACPTASIPSCLILPAFQGNATFVLNFLELHKPFTRAVWPAAGMNAGACFACMGDGMNGCLLLHAF